MEWIQQNRPRSSEKENLNVGILAAEKLPYYGRYCGSFVEQVNKFLNSMADRKNDEKIYII